MAFLKNQWMERVLFTIVIAGILLSLYGVARVIDTSIKLSNNIAQQQHNSGEALDIQSTAEGRGMMVADLERRELIKVRGQMIFIAGAGIVLLGLGWQGYDLRNGRIRKENEAELELAEASETA